MGSIPLDTKVSFQTSENPDPAFLQPFADELLGIAARLFDVASSANKPPQPNEALSRQSIHPIKHYLPLARKVYNLRRKRASIFNRSELFGEPAWDILLDLFIAQAEGKAVSVSSACIGSAAPATTGLRWLGILADEGLVVRENDPEDQRRVMVRLTDAGVTAMERFFDAAEAVA